MHQSPPRLLALWLCLLSCLLNGAALGKGLVICVDGHGHTRIEIGCDCGGGERGSRGGDLAQCDGDECDHCPGTCSDTPVQSDSIIARAASHGQSDHSVPTLVPFVAPEPAPQLRAFAGCLRSLPTQTRPPDSLMRLRCVKLLV